ncbi:Sca4 family protein [Candidatus Tisiphia endosymbiont of Xenochironomus xenolabis]|uniref:Sca4 family protein n=1 Tax=Candidatus Tisiphia endosymbiont of Xenochironomus xenolabis TaxID=3139334 RepID=UPI0035C93BCE
MINKNYSKKNSQDIAALNVMITDLEKEHESLTKQEQKLKDYSLSDNLADDAELQRLFEERQADITKKIDNIISQQDDSELKKQYESIKLQEEEIKLIQNQIEEKNQIIKQTKQKAEELFAKLEQLQQESSIPQFSSKQEREEIVNQYPILQERTNDVIASIKHQIELNKLNDLIEQQGDKINIEKDRADSLAQQLEKLKLSADEQIRGNLIVIKELREKIKGLEEEKEQQLITPQGPNWAEELERIGEANKLVQLEKQIGELTKENGDLKGRLEALETLSAEKDEKLKVVEEGYRKELSKQLAQTAIDVAKLQVENEELSNLQTQLKSEQQGRQEELEGKQQELNKSQKELSDARDEVNKTKELYGKEEEQTKKLQTQVGELTKSYGDLQNELKVEKEKHKEELNRQLAELQAENKELSNLGTQLQSQQQEKQKELNKSQEELANARDKLENTNKKLQTQEGELTNAQQQFTTKLEEAENQLKALSANKDLEYNKLNAEKERLEVKLKKQSEQAEAGVTELRELSEKLSNLQTQLESEQQGRQEELEGKQQELNKSQKELSDARDEVNKTKELYGKEEEQTKKLQTQVGELTKSYGDLQNELKVEKEKHKEELKKQSERAEAGVTELREVSEKLLNLQTQLKSEQQGRQEELDGKQKIIERLQESLSVESNHSKELQTQVDKLATDNSKLQDEINVAEEKHKEEFSKQLVQTAIDAAKLQAVNDALLQGVIGDLSQLKSEQQGRQEELEGKQKIIERLQESLSVEQKKFEKEKEQTENLQTQVGELTNAQQQFTTKLEEAEKNAKNQLEALSVKKDLVYNELKAEKDSLENELDKQSKVAAEQAQENRKNASRITELESQNAELLAQLASLNVKVETSEVEMQTDEVLSNEMRSVGTGTEPVMGSGVSTKEAMTNTTEVIIQEQTVSPITERQTIDKMLFHDNDDDKILQAFKKLSRDQVQPIIDKCGLESGSNFAKFAKEDVNKLSEVFQDTQILRDIENIEQKGYADIHKEFASEYKDIIWQSKDAEKSFNLQQNGKDVAIISEKKLSYDNDVEYKTSDGESIKNARTVNIPLSMDIKGSCHMSFAVQDTNGRSISKENAVYLTAHYNNGKLVHLTKPTEIFACSDDKNSPLYLKRDGKIYTLPVNKYALEQLEKEVLKNKGEYVGIVKNASGDIVSINSGASQDGRSERLKDDASFKIASQVLHANATHTTNSPIDRKVLPKKHSQYTNRGL